MSVTHRKLKYAESELFEFDNEDFVVVLRQIADWLDGTSKVVHVIQYDNRIEDNELKQSFAVYYEDV